MYPYPYPPPQPPTPLPVRGLGSGPAPYRSLEALPSNGSEVAPGALYGSRGAEGGVIRVNSLVVLISMVLGGDRYNWYSPLLYRLSILIPNIPVLTHRDI